MSVEQNKAIVRRFVEEVPNKGNMAVADELLSPHYVGHNLPPGMPSGPEGLKQMVTMFHTAFPDFHVVIEDQVAEGDKVVNRVTVSGTHKGQFMVIAPTGKQVTVSGIQFWRLADGKIEELWFNRDDLGMMRQLGVIPTPS